MAEETLNDIHQAVRAILPQVIMDGVQHFQKAIEGKRIVNTADLLNQITSQIKDEAEAVIGSITFNEYGRFRDMKYLRWAGEAPPVDELEKWVLDKGISSFAWVPGYEYATKIPSDTKAARRIASAISHSMGSVEATKKKYSGTWYNENKMKMINIARVRILKRVSELITQNTKEIIESNNTDG